MSRDIKEMKDQLDHMEKRVCLDCGVRMQGCGARNRTFNVGYMLKNELWRMIINNEDGSRDGLLCIICAQLRLGRKVEPSDFTPAPINLREGSVLWLMFPDEFKAHMQDFVKGDTADEEE